MNIFSNFVPKKMVTLDDSNPLWINEFIKNKIKWKHKHKNLHKKWLQRSDYIKFQKATSLVPEVISRHKEEYQIIQPSS